MKKNWQNNSKCDTYFNLMLDNVLSFTFPAGKFPLWRQGSMHWNPKLSVSGLGKMQKTEFLQWI